MESIWILGSGHFGTLALHRLSAGKRGRRFVVVDESADKLPASGLPNVEFIADEGVRFLRRVLDSGHGPEWIVPALPVHLAAMWCIAGEDGRIRRCPPPAGLEAALPNVMRGDTGDLYVSMADFMCPDDCPEPAVYCPKTGKKRTENLYDRIRGLHFAGLSVLVVQSRQLAPGVGGFEPSALFDIRRKMTGKDGRYLLATACRCHGVITPVEACAIQPEGGYDDR